MSKNRNNYIKPELILNSKVEDNKKDYYENVYKRLPPMVESSLNITGIKLEKSQSREIVVQVFIQSTLPKSVYIEGYPVVLLDKNNKVVARKREKFEGLGEFAPNTAKLWEIRFSNEQIEQYDFEKLEKWTVAFEENLEHRLDLSGLDESKISKETKNFLKEIISKKDFTEEGLTLTGLSANKSDSGRVNVTLLISNSTQRSLEIKQLPLKLFDAKDILTAQGTFQMQDLIVQANTSKTISIVFPPSSILNKNMDLTSWSLVHHE